MHRLLEELARTTIDERVRAASKFHGHTQHDPTGTHRLEMSVSTWGRRTLSAFARSFVKPRNAVKSFICREHPYPIHEPPGQQPRY